MMLRVNKPAVLEIISTRFGSVDGLLVEWEARSRDKRGAVSYPKNRSTIYRWIDKGLPSRADAVFEFCGLLDVDLVAILDLDRSGIRRDFAAIRRSFQSGRARESALQPLFEMYLPGQHWPPKQLAERYYDRPWWFVDFEHDPNQLANVYALLEMAVPDSIGHDKPIGFHIAYRRKGAADHMWRPYGFILRQNERVQLFSESGDFQERSNQEEKSIVRVETFFGSGPAEFRLASLHEFALTVVVPSDRSGNLRFRA